MNCYENLDGHITHLDLLLPTKSVEQLSKQQSAITNVPQIPTIFEF